MFESIESDIQELFSNLTKELRVVSFSIEIQKGLFPSGNGILLKVRPHSEKCAGINVTAENGNGEVKLFFGKGGILEVNFPESEYAGIVTLEAHIRNLCEAIILGKIHEKVWYRNSTLIRAETFVFLGNEWHKYSFVRWGGYLFYRFRNSEENAYEPWV